MTQLKALIDNWILTAQGLLASVGALAFHCCWFRCTDRKDECVGLAIPAAGRWTFSAPCSVRMKPARAHLSIARARRVLTAVSNGRVLRCT